MAGQPFRGAEHGRAYDARGPWTAAQRRQLSVCSQSSGRNAAHQLIYLVPEAHTLPPPSKGDLFFSRLRKIRSSMMTAAADRTASATSWE